MYSIFPPLILSGKACLNLRGDIAPAKAPDLFDDAYQLARRSNVSELVVYLTDVRSMHPLIVLVLFALKQEVELLGKTFDVKLDDPSLRYI